MGSLPALPAKPSVARYTDSVRQPRIQLRIIESARLLSALKFCREANPTARLTGCRSAQRTALLPHHTDRLCNGSGAGASGSTISREAKEVHQFRQFLWARDRRRDVQRPDRGARCRRTRADSRRDPDDGGITNANHRFTSPSSCWDARSRPTELSVPCWAVHPRARAGKRWRFSRASSDRQRAQATERPTPYRLTQFIILGRDAEVVARAVIPAQGAPWLRLCSAHRELT